MVLNDLYFRTAGKLSVDPDLVRAIAVVESSEIPMHRGKPTVRFEPHVFRRHTRHKMELASRVLSELVRKERVYRATPEGQRIYAGQLQALQKQVEIWNDLYEAYGNRMHLYDLDRNQRLDQSEQWRLVETACGLSEVAGVSSTSWGMFQIMGFNSRFCGYESPLLFRDAMMRGAPEQATAFSRFVLHPDNKQLHDALRERDLARIAYHYNGPGYAKNAYDKKLTIALDRIRQEKALVG